MLLKSDQGYHYRWLLTTCDSWRTRSPSWGTGLLNDNLHQWKALRETTRCLLNQESLLWQPVRQVTWIRILETLTVQVKLSDHWQPEEQGSRQPPIHRASGCSLNLVEQWIDNLNNNNEMSCLEKKLNTTMVLLPLLNKEQILKSATLKIQEATGDQWVFSFGEYKGGACRSNPFPGK